MVVGQHNKMNFLKKIYYEKYTKRTYSLTGVDLIIDHLFRNISKGVYIDVGCIQQYLFTS